MAKLADHPELFPVCGRVLDKFTPGKTPTQPRLPRSLIAHQSNSCCRILDGLADRSGLLQRTKFHIPDANDIPGIVTSD